MTESNLILIAEDEANMRRIMEASLKRRGFQTLGAGNGEDALEMMRSIPVQVLITDLKMPRMNGMELLKAVSVEFPDIPVIILTAHGTVENAVEAMKHGAFDYISKPFEMDELEMVLKKSLNMYDRNLQEPHQADVIFEHGFVTRSANVRKVLDMVSRVADSPTTILITGESGTGKELIAQRIHALSSRTNKPFIKVNCAAIPETLLESEFFGYEKGAFTGAVSSKPGRFELANTGTLFLDEIGEISREMQVKLLRVLQEREFERVGGLNTIQVDVRLVVATNIDLEQAVKEGRFRQDLYYRLNVVSIHLPPLRDRLDDIPLLIEFFIQRYNKRLNRHVEGIDSTTLNRLINYAWPGNIRELENVLERAVLLATEPTLTDENFEDVILSEGTVPVQTQVRLREGVSLKDIMSSEIERLERVIVETALEDTGGNVTRAAKKLGLSRKGLQLKMKRYGLQSGSGNENS